LLLAAIWTGKEKLTSAFRDEISSEYLRKMMHIIYVNGIKLAEYRSQEPHKLVLCASREILLQGIRCKHQTFGASHIVTLKPTKTKNALSDGLIVKQFVIKFLRPFGDNPAANFGHVFFFCHKKINGIFLILLCKLKYSYIKRK
jgi:hypothetical protein